MVRLALHGLMALIVIPFILFFILGIGDNMLRASPLKWIVELGGLANPVVWVPGFVLGFLINRKTLNRIACWTWIGGVGWLAYGILDSLRGYDPRFYQGCSPLENVVNAFFVVSAYRCGGGSSTLEAMLFTLPALSAAAYAMGGWVAIRLDHRKGEAGGPGF